MRATATVQRVAGVVLFTAALLPAVAARAADNDKKAKKADIRETQFFETTIRPLFAAHCYKCHSSQSGKIKGGFALDTRDGFFAGGEHGSVIEAGDPKYSTLIRAVSRTDSKLQMPPKDALSAAQVQALTKWVKMGAPWPKENATASGVAAKNGAKWTDVAGKYDQLRKEHWSFQPVKDVPPLKTAPSAWAKTDIDQYILAKLTEHELQPSKAADRRTLIRRATFDLTGLPPTPEEVDAFVNDNSSKAWEKVVDRLLASPTFGERWGRHWLDVARYAESTGLSRNVPIYYAWRYRDYVIDSFNADKPYDQFIKEQLAGDLLPATTDAQRDRQLVATGFLAIGQKDLNERNPLQFVLNNVDEQIDATGRAFLGLTIACARCHDHKFDPIPTAEYYSLAGIFRSTEMLAGVANRRQGDFYKADGFLNLSTSGKGGKSVAEATGGRYSSFASADATDDGDDNGKGDKKDRKEQRRERLQEMLRQRQKQQDQQNPNLQNLTPQQRKLVENLRAAARSQPEAEIRPVAIGVKDGRIPLDSNIFVRGEPEQRGPVVPRGTITLPGLPPIGPIQSDHSGRLELADWIANTKNPLTARVMVNRIWLHLFGAGLVRTVDNFGTTGDAPTHPELLDHLATQFQGDGWSVKHMIRRIMLSSTYQQAGTFDEAKYAVDPDNHFFWRASPRRLEGEAIRDGMLSASGKLDRKRPVASSIQKAPPVDIGRAARLMDRFAGPNDVRSVYLPILRGGILPPMLDVFDMADNSQVTGSRETTTVAPQALFMMNDRFVLAQSEALAKRVATERIADNARVDRAYMLALGRTATDAERGRALKYIKEFSKDAATDPKKRSRAEEDAWTSICQALFASAEFRYLY
jgi:mono/diheme cytochrome c family protein